MTDYKPPFNIYLTTSGNAHLLQRFTQLGNNLFDPVPVTGHTVLLSVRP